jgi:hypothetical protein
MRFVVWFRRPDKAQFRRPDKAKPPSGIAPEGNVRAVCRMALRLSGLRRFSNMGFPGLIRRSFVGLIRRSRHQALHRRMMCGLFAGWRFAYPAYAVSATWFPHA